MTVEALLRRRRGEGTAALSWKRSCSVRTAARLGELLDLGVTLRCNYKASQERAITHSTTSQVHLS